MPHLNQESHLILWLSDACSVILKTYAHVLMMLHVSSTFKISKKVIYMSFDVSDGLNSMPNLSHIWVRGAGNTHQTTNLSTQFYCLRLILFTGGTGCIYHSHNMVFLHIYM